MFTLPALDESALGELPKVTCSTNRFDERAKSLRSYRLLPRSDLLLQQELKPVLVWKDFHCLP